jgi:hypothetical protein
MMPVARKKPQPANRRSRRAAGEGNGRRPNGPRPPAGATLVEALRRIVRDNDAEATESRGLMMGEGGWMFHRDGEFAYAVTVGKTRVTLHVMPMYCSPSIHAAYSKRIRDGKFGKGCIRFKLDAAPELSSIAALIRDCAKL